MHCWSNPWLGVLTAPLSASCNEVLWLQSLILTQDRSSVHWYPYSPGEEYDSSECGKKSKLKFFCYSFIPFSWLNLKTNSHTELTNGSEMSITNCFRILTDKLNLWVTVDINTSLFSGGIQSIVLLRANMDYSGANLNMKEDSQVSWEFIQLCLYECMPII